MEGKLDAVLGIEKGGREAPQLSRKELADELLAHLKTGHLNIPKGWCQWIVEGRLEDGCGKHYTARDLIDLEVVSRGEDGRWRWSETEVAYRVPCRLFQVRSGGMSERWSL
jgi:hypothetical protein